MRILVTGGAGFIGSHLVALLVSSGEEVEVLDDLSSGRAENIPSSVPLIKMNINDERLAEKVAAGQFDAIVHLAAQTMVDTSIKEPKRDMQINIAGTLNVLEAARLSGVRRVVFASTAASYGDVAADKLPIKETEPLNPLSFYGLSKITVEKYLDLYQKLFGLEYVVLRFANVYGERQGMGGEGGVISIFAKLIAENKGIKIFGSGGQTRDFVYAGDIARGIYSALRSVNDNEVYNLCTATETSLNELVKILARVAKKKISPRYETAREGDIERSMLDNAKARDKLGWEAEVSLEEGLTRTYNYFKRVSAK